MMIECPRCGFAQPKDKYCASCGVDMDQLLAVPQPFLVRILQNPSLHLSLIGVLIAVVVGWIFYTQSAIVSREVGKLLDLPISSKDAADPGADRAAPTPPANDDTQQAAARAPEPAQDADPSAVSAESESAAKTTAASDLVPTAAAAAARMTRIEVAFYEIPRDLLGPLNANSERVGEGNAGRAFLWKEGAKVLETLQAQGQSLSSPRGSSLQSGAQVVYETGPGEGLQFGLAVQPTRDAKDGPLGVRWEATLVSPQGEPVADQPPRMLEATMSGQVQTFANGSVLVLVFEPAQRTLREELISRLGEGPWMIFGSMEFRSNMTEWVAVIQLK